MVKTEEKELEGSTYRVTQLTASDGRRMLVLLIKILGPCMGRLIDSSKEGLQESISGAIYELSTSISDKHLDRICEVFGQHTVVVIDGVEQRLDMTAQELHFAGKYGLMFRWLAFCLEVNFRDFIESLQSAGTKLGGEGDLVGMMANMKQSSSPKWSRNDGISGV